MYHNISATSVKPANNYIKRSSMYAKKGDTLISQQVVRVRRYKVTNHVNYVCLISEGEFVRQKKILFLLT